MPGWPAYLLPLLQDLPRALTNNSSEFDSSSLIAARQAYDFVMLLFCVCHSRCFERTLSNSPRALHSSVEPAAPVAQTHLDAPVPTPSARLRITSPTQSVVHPTSPEDMKNVFTTQALKLFEKCATEFTKVFPVSLRAALQLSSFDCYALPRSMLSVFIAKVCASVENHFTQMAGKWANIALIVRLVQSFIFEIPPDCATPSRRHAFQHIKVIDRHVSPPTVGSNLSSTSAAATSSSMLPVSSSETASLLDQRAVHTLSRFTPQSFVVDVAIGKAMKGALTWMPDPVAVVKERSAAANLVSSGSAALHAPGVTHVSSTDALCFEFPLIQDSSTIGLHWREPGGLQADITLILVTIQLLKLIHVSSAETDADVPVEQNQWIPDEPVEVAIYERLQQVSLPLLQETLVFLQLMQQRVQLLADNEIQQLIRMFVTSTSADARTRIFTSPFQ
jgi:hypothetical protein